MPTARIYKSSKNPMQSGRAKTTYWVLEHLATCQKTPDPLMSWNSSTDTEAQLKLTFSSEEEAIDYAKKNGISFEVIPARQRKIKPKSYAVDMMKRWD